MLQRLRRGRIGCRLHSSGRSQHHSRISLHTLHATQGPQPVGLSGIRQIHHKAIKGSEHLCGTSREPKAAQQRHRPLLNATLTRSLIEKNDVLHEEGVSLEPGITLRRRNNSFLAVIRDARKNPLAIALETADNAIAAPSAPPLMHISFYVRTGHSSGTGQLNPSYEGNTAPRSGDLAGR